MIPGAAAPRTGVGVGAAAAPEGRTWHPTAPTCSASSTPASSKEASHSAPLLRSRAASTRHESTAWGILLHLGHRIAMCETQGHGVKVHMCTFISSTQSIIAHDHGYRCLQTRYHPRAFLDGASFAPLKRAERDQQPDQISLGRTKTQSGLMNKHKLGGIGNSYAGRRCTLRTKQS